MATNRGWAMKGNIVNLVNYILDIGNGESKTENGFYVTTSDGFAPMSEAFRWKNGQEGTTKLTPQKWGVIF